jgi:Flp pilus assembly protein TadG
LPIEESAMRLKGYQARSGAHLVECALVFPLVFLLTIGLVVGGMGIYRYQQVCYLAREAARYASVHGGQYQQEKAALIANGTLPNVNEQFIVTNIITANATNMDPASTQVNVNFNMSGGSYDWDDTTDNNNRWPSSPRTINGVVYNETNTVGVTITYTWSPELFLIGPITLTSTSVMPMCY